MSEHQQQHKAPITIDTTRTTTTSWDPNAMTHGITTTHSEQQQQPVRHRNSETVTPTFTNFSPVSADSPPTSPADRRMSAEWDASKVPPSRFQKRKGSIYAVPKTRDGHVDTNYAHAFHQKHMEKGYHNVK
ncbi:hypothetical protein SMACR_03796 [Sordaria macrospora]|uniref:WGS project CABT00000000 data, contig 2.16 n=2 Tax=Sordaria macrospora TaxID=5147 RepID=F7VZZ0_SORMK|nr:uncharacterized protein SMAC_03796 [Sordaria macrospora k-hell]KAA8636566.1 hypothetical protein SMACR_03796 [Sordaria macrospora]KAH7631353.1 hypothetical protein B0T09DRAFT_133768 [Sordaria sp. MPI-SDFR-AT-0083]WPJ61565.1 hypothetical protein SMAC4_03796 [Sordaria macrospora]CCC11089.1 unnamed protein product [Sordaria macrospora k-hell]